MGVAGIESAIDRTLERLTGNKELQKDVKAAFLELLDQVFTDAGVRNGVPGAAEATPAAATPAAATPVATTLYPAAQPAATDTTEAPRFTGGFAHEYLLDPAQPALAQLPDTLEAGDLRYNEREAMLRARLDIPALERRLRAYSESLGIAYRPEDLNGVLRNAGYDSVHLGSSERYMAAIERGMVAAEAALRYGATNVPGQG